MEATKIKFHKKLYEINTKKAIEVLKCFGEENANENNIKELFKKHKLYDEYFLEHINEL